MSILEQLSEELIVGNATAVTRLTTQALEAGLSPQTILDEGLIAGMNVVGNRFRNCEMFLPEVLTSARAMKAGVAQLEPLFAAAGVKPVGKIIIGTVRGDIHDIGKNLVAIMLRGAGFEIVDLGVGVTAQKFVDAVREHQPNIVGISAMLTTTMMQMKTIIAALAEAGLRDRIKIMIGGAPVNKAFAEEIAADAYGRNASDAVEKARSLINNAKTTGT